MLTGSKRRQLATVALGVLPHLRHPLAHILAELGQILCVVKLAAYPLITLVVCHPARPVPTVMGDIEGLIAFWCRCHLGLRHRIGIIHTTHLLILGEQRARHQAGEAK